MSKKPDYIAAVDASYQPPADREKSEIARVFIDIPVEIEGDDIATAFWKTSVRARAETGLVTAGDYPMLVLMAQCWSDLQDARKQSTGARVVESASGHPMRSPWSSIEKDARSQYAAYENQLTKRETSRGAGKSGDSLD